MVKRLKDIAAASSDSKLAGTIKDSAQQIWLAGLGAFSKAQEEGVKVFDALVKEGKGLESKTRKMTEERVGEVTDQMNKAAHTATTKANAAWDKLEQVFEDRVARSLHRIGVPTNKDIQSLSRQVEELSATVKSLRAKQSKPASKLKPAKTPAKKAAAKRKAG
ncbi:MAG: phasin family protein [Lysobacterales bacterium]